jgi:6-phosphofructo-2-kinase/fructose-2,6-biphosphatase 4
LAIRLEDILLELERERDDVLIIAHPTVLRCIYAYLTDVSDVNQIPEIEIPEEVLIELQPAAYGCKERRYDIQDKAN